MALNQIVEQFKSRMTDLGIGQQITFSDPDSNADYIAMAIASLQTDDPSTSYTQEIKDDLVYINRLT